MEKEPVLTAAVQEENTNTAARHRTIPVPHPVHTPIVPGSPVINVMEAAKQAAVPVAEMDGDNTKGEVL